jgi:hypothetical protein
MGIPATEETKKARRAAHEVLDTFKVFFNLTKNQTYKELCRLMGLSRAEGHIGRFGIKQCDRLIDLLNVEMAKVDRT